MAWLKKAGYTSYKLEHDGLISTSTATRLRRGRGISTKTLDTLCSLLKCQPGDLLEWVPDEKEDRLKDQESDEGGGLGQCSV